MLPKANSSPLENGGEGRASFPFEIFSLFLGGELLVLEMVSAALALYLLAAIKHGKTNIISFPVYNSVRSWKS